jgi:YHS domain-containing protein
MKARWMMVPLGLALLLAAKGFSAAGDKESGDKEFEATCPVSGKPAGEDHVVELKNGQKVYFCCDNCPKAYKADPKKFELKVDRQLLETGQIVQVACPFTGKKINEEAKAEVAQADVHFCCKNCLAKFEKASDDEKLKLVFSQAALKKGFTSQTKCPVSGKDIDPEHVVEYKGEKVYFCCPNCPKAFEANPEKYVAKLPQLKADKGQEPKE